MTAAAALQTMLVGPHFGLIEALERAPLEFDDPFLHVFAGRLANTDALFRGAKESNAGRSAPPAVSGAAIDVKSALAACLGEAVERYCAALPRPGAIVHGIESDLPGRVISPDRFALFDDRQLRSRAFPFVRWDPSQPSSWAQASSLSDGSAAWIPAVFVHQPFIPEPNEPCVAPSLSTGLACGSTWENAVVAGLCEVIERDAVSLAWLGCLAPPAIVASQALAGCAAAPLAAELESRGFRWRVFDLTTDLGVPVAAALIEGRSSLGSIVSFGSACRPRLEDAAAKALIEAAHGRLYIKSLMREEPAWRAGRRFENVRSFADHARVYSVHPGHRAALERWWSAPEGTSTRQGFHEPTPSSAWLESQIDRLADLGFEAFSIDLTTPDVRALSLHGARVVVPGLQPLHGHHGWPHLGGGRLLRLAEVFGSRAEQPRRWNPYPHPCP